MFDRAHGEGCIKVSAEIASALAEQTTGHRDRRQVRVLPTARCWCVRQSLDKVSPYFALLGLAMFGIALLGDTKGGDDAWSGGGRPAMAGRGLLHRSDQA